MTKGMKIWKVIRKQHVYKQGAAAYKWQPPVYGQTDKGNFFATFIGYCLKYQI